jgi:hydroxymethylglutaryl-CoA reductase
LIINSRKARTVGKRAVLKGHFHLSTKELRNAVIAAEKDTVEKAKQKVKNKAMPL